MGVVSSRQARAIGPVPALLLACTFVVSVGLVATFWLGWAIWLIAFLVIAAWLPVFYLTTRAISHRSLYLAFFFVLVCTQGGHFIEHLAQMIQIELLGINPMEAHGIIGTLDIEWVHFIWNSWVLIYGALLLFWSRKNPWLWALLILAIWHECEHVYIIDCYIKTGMVGLPGLLARGGALWGGLPIGRPALHFLYTLFEETFIICGYLRTSREPGSIVE